MCYSISTLQLPVVTILVIAAGFFIGGPSNILTTVMGAEIAKDPKLRGNESVELYLYLLYLNCDSLREDMLYRSWRLLLELLMDQEVWVLL